jgi:hypothetical protein
MSKVFALVPALLTSVALVATAAPSFAQSATDEIELIRVIIEAERKVVVATNMNLSDAESEAFWPVYNEFETELSRNFETLTDEQAADLLEEHFKFQQERVKVRKSYMKKFKKVLSGKQLARFYQIDGKIDTIIDFDIARAVPLVN